MNYFMISRQKTALLFAFCLWCCENWNIKFILHFSLTPGTTTYTVCSIVYIEHIHTAVDRHSVVWKCQRTISSREKKEVAWLSGCTNMNLSCLRNQYREGTEIIVYSENRVDGHQRQAMVNEEHLITWVTWLIFQLWDIQRTAGSLSQTMH